MRVEKVPLTWRWDVFCHCNTRMNATKGNSYRCPKCGETVSNKAVDFLKGGGMN